MRTISRMMAGLAARAGLGPVAYWMVGWWRKLSRPRILLDNRRLRRHGAPDGLPIPPDHLLVLVDGTPSIDWYLASGARSAAAIRDVVADAGRPLDSFRDVLDFGCGCGRVLRSWRSVEGPAFHGCDYNARLVRWTRDNLPFAHVALNGSTPPLPYGDDAFDLVYAVSVFTHLPEDMQLAWMAEMRRVLRPGGYLLVTLHGDLELYRHLMTDAEAERFRAGRLVVTNPESRGTNVCAAFHPEPYVRARLSRGFEILAHEPRSALGNGGQDHYLMRALGNSVPPS